MAATITRPRPRGREPRPRSSPTAFTLYLETPGSAVVPLPPLLVSADHFVRSGLGQRSLPKLLGFADPITGVITIWARELAGAAAAAVGNRPVLLIEGRIWRHPGIVAEVTVRDHARTPAPRSNS